MNIRLETSDHAFIAMDEVPDKTRPLVVTWEGRTFIFNHCGDWNGEMIYIYTETVPMSLPPEAAGSIQPPATENQGGDAGINAGGRGELEPCNT